MQKTLEPHDHVAMSLEAIDHTSAGVQHIELAVFAQALGLNETADFSSIVAAIEGFRVLKEAETLDQVRRALSLPAYADAIYCAADLCRRLPAEYGVTAMFRIDVKERERAACVAEIQATALRTLVVSHDG